MPKPQKFCIYCGNPGMSKEHMWPDWLKKYVPRKISSWDSQSVTLYRERTPDHKVERHTGDPHAAKLRIVCGACNNGWMSRLQESAKPILVPMLQGKGTILYRKDQQLLARWIAMLVMTNEFSARDHTKIATSGAERRFVMGRDRPPANWRMWIGRYNRADREGLWAHHSIPIADDKHAVEMTHDNRPISNTQATTFIVGHIYVTVLSSALTFLVRRWNFGESGERFLVQIWPIKNILVQWPPPAMTHDDAEGFSGAFFSIAARKKVPFGKHFSMDE